MKTAIQIIALFLATGAAAQTKTAEELNFETRHKNIYGEFLGSSLLGGVHFDMRLKKGVTDGIGFRVGVGGIVDNSPSISAPFGFENSVSLDRLSFAVFPIEFNHLLGKKMHYFVSGIGIMPSLVTYTGVIAEGYTGSPNFTQLEFTGAFLNLGYRLQPKKTGIMAQISWNPMLLKGSGINAGWLSIGLGIGFK